MAGRGRRLSDAHRPWPMRPVAGWPRHGVALRGFEPPRQRPACFGCCARFVRSFHHAGHQTGPCPRQTAGPVAVPPNPCPGVLLPGCGAGRQMIVGRGLTRDWARAATLPPPPAASDRRWQRHRGDVFGSGRGEGPPRGPFDQRNPGGVLLSQGESTQVPSALEGLTAVFGMGTGVTPPLWPPEILRIKGRPPTHSRRGPTTRSATPQVLHSEHEQCKSKPSAD